MEAVARFLAAQDGFHERHTESDRPSVPREVLVEDVETFLPASCGKDLQRVAAEITTLSREQRLAAELTQDLNGLPEQILSLRPWQDITVHDGLKMIASTIKLSAQSQKSSSTLNTSQPFLHTWDVENNRPTASAAAALGDSLFDPVTCRCVCVCVFQ